MDFIFEGFFEAYKLLVSGNAETYSAILATVKVSSGSIACSLLLGIPLGFCLGYFDFSGKETAQDRCRYDDGPADGVYRSAWFTRF